MTPSHPPTGMTAYNHCPIPSHQRPPALPPPDKTWPIHGPYRGLFTDITNLVATEDQVPAVLCAQAALAIGALALQNQVAVERPNDGSSVPVSALIVGIAASGERKSQIIRRFMQPLMSYLAAQEDREAWARYQKERAHWEKTHKRLNNELARAYAHQLIEEGDADSEVLNDE